MVTNNTEDMEQQMDSYKKDIHSCIYVNTGHATLNKAATWFSGVWWLCPHFGDDTRYFTLLCFCRTRISLQRKVQYLIVCPQGHANKNSDPRLLVQKLSCCLMSVREIESLMTEFPGTQVPEKNRELTRVGLWRDEFYHRHEASSWCSPERLIIGEHVQAQERHHGWAS